MNNLYFYFMVMLWHLTSKENRKPWDEFKSGLIEHTCVFEETFYKSGYVFQKCNHFGCNRVIPFECEDKEYQHIIESIYFYEDRIHIIESCRLTSCYDIADRYKEMAKVYRERKLNYVKR